MKLGKLYFLFEHEFPSSIKWKQYLIFKKISQNKYVEQLAHTKPIHATVTAVELCSCVRYEQFFCQNWSLKPCGVDRKKKKQDGGSRVGVEKEREAEREMP